LALDLDVLVFAEIGMHLVTYLLAFLRLARRVAMYWGHGITTGIPHDAVHAFISCKDFHTDSAFVTDGSGTPPSHTAAPLVVAPLIDPTSHSRHNDEGQVLRLAGLERSSQGRWVSRQDQARFVERLYLMDSLTTVIPRPPVAHTARSDARAMLANLLTTSPFRRYGDRSVDGRDNRVVFVSDTSRDGSLRVGSRDGKAVNVYLCPQVSCVVLPIPVL
jgi:hypothetical protein